MPKELPLKDNNSLIITTKRQPKKKREFSSTPCGNIKTEMMQKNKRMVCVTIIFIHIIKIIDSCCRLRRKIRKQIIKHCLVNGKFILEFFFQFSFYKE